MSVFVCMSGSCRLLKKFPDDPVTSPTVLTELDMIEEIQKQLWKTCEWDQGRVQTMGDVQELSNILINGPDQMVS